MPIYEFKCEEHGVFEALSKMDDRHFHSCPKCNEQCPMIISAVRSALDPISGDFPGATMSWAKRRESKMRQEVKQDKTRIE